MSEESYEMTEEYQKEAAKLFELMERRKEMQELLKIAHPSKIAEIRVAIARIDDITERTEKVMELHAEKYRLEKDLDRQYEDLAATTDAILPELLAHLAEHNPEAYQKLKADLEEIDANAEEEEDE